MVTRIFRTVSWAVLAAVIAVTLSPIGLRPHDLLPVDIDRALAFLVLAGLFVMAYPRQAPLIAFFVMLCPGFIEVMQALSPSLHPHVHDAAVKTAGAAIGIVVGWTANMLLKSRQVLSSRNN